MSSNLVLTFQDVQEFDPLSFIIVEAKHDKPGVLGEIMQPRGSSKGAIIVEAHGSHDVLRV